MDFSKATFTKILTDAWKGSVISQEITLHQLSPYIGKMKSSMAGSLVLAVTEKKETIYDPFSGSGTIVLEAWRHGRNVISNDLSPYAHLLTQAKLNPYNSFEDANKEMAEVVKEVEVLLLQIDLRNIPKWVRAFFHPETLREIFAWVTILKDRKMYFLLSCLLGILHHQRPGFLSFPSSHTVPYLRVKKFPQNIYPELYTHRSVYDRLLKKVSRALKRIPNLDFSLHRRCYMKDASKLTPDKKVDAIITSPPYMRQLDYARDNRLRLWFLENSDFKTLDKIISPTENVFLNLMYSCLQNWKEVLKPKGICILVLGNTLSKVYGVSLPEAVEYIATREIGGYKKLFSHTEAVPDNRRVRRGCSGCQEETILILNNKG